MDVLTVNSCDPVISFFRTLAAENPAARECRTLIDFLQRIEQHGHDAAPSPRVRPNLHLVGGTNAKTPIR